MALGLVALMADRWYGDFQNRKHHLMLGFARSQHVSHVLYVEPWSDAGSDQVRSVIPGKLTVFRPGATITRSALPLLKMIRRLGIHEYVLWAHAPLYAQLVRYLSPSAILYDCTDDYSTLEPTHAEAIREGDKYLLQRAGVVTTVSRALYEQKAAYHGHVHMLPNAVDTRHFTPYRDHPMPTDLAALLPATLVAYVGHVNQRINRHLVETLADSRPDLQLVFLGPVHASVAAMVEKRNIHLLGRKDYRELPAYLAHVDVCVIPHEINAVTGYMNPIKAYEYLAMGKPVVATPVPGLEELTDGLIIARDSGTFSSAIDLALERRGGEQAEALRRLVSAHTWDSRVERAWELLQGCLASRAGAAAAS